MKKFKRSIRSDLMLSLLIPGFILLLLVTSVILFSTLYITQKDTIYLYVLISTSVSLFVIFAFLSIFIVIHLNKLYYHGLYEVTSKNLDAVFHNRFDFVKYPKKFSFKEVDELNDKLNKIGSLFQNSTIISNKLDYKTLDLEFIEGYDNVVTFKSFKAQLENLILFASSFRNVVFEVYYEIDDMLSDEEIKRNISLLDKHFACYSYVLFALNKDNNSLFVFVPFVDTLNRLIEQLTTIIQSTSIIRRTIDGLLTYNARISLVAYPYSKTSEIFHDLNYAKRDNKTISTYFPKRLKTLDEYFIKNDAVNLNTISSVMESIGCLKASNLSKIDHKSVISRSLKSLFAYFNVDEAGMMMIDFDDYRFYSYINHSTSKDSLFKEGNLIEPEFISFLSEVIDTDNSYYFSSRNHVNKSLGRHFDRYNISSGFYYLLKDDKDRPVAILYFFRKDKEFILSSYIREGLVLYSDRIMSFIENSIRENDTSKLNDVIKNILMLTQYSTYKVDNQTHEIISFSRNINTIFPNVKKGEHCYKAFFGLDKPCEKCPLTLGKKVTFQRDKMRFEASLNLNKDNTSRHTNVLIKILDNKEISTDRFNKDFLIHSFPALVESIENCYAMKGKGHLLLLRIDNIFSLVEKYGSEKTSVALRTFLSNIKSAFGGVENIFYFNAQTFAILLQETGQIDVVNECEKIYDISKQDYFVKGEESNGLMVTYLPMIYPSSYPSAKDFLKNAQVFFDSNSYEINKDFIYFEENDYARPASKNEFMLTVIDDKFGNSTFTALLQPYLNAGSKKIIGVEMLLRLHDDYRNITFNPSELIKIASNHGKMRIISDSLIRFVGNIYQKQGSSLFKTFGLERFSINIDYSYFKDSEAVKSLLSLVDEFNFPKNFLVFEIPEKDIEAHVDGFKKVIQDMKKANITFVCDQYLGDSLSLNRLKNIGFNEIKVSRSLVGMIDSDPSKRESLTFIGNEAKELGMEMSVVGIDNQNQYEIVKEINEDIMVQGFYFFKPLDKNTLITTLRNTNR